MNPLFEITAHMKDGSQVRFAHTYTMATATLMAQTFRHHYIYGKADTEFQDFTIKSPIRATDA